MTLTCNPVENAPRRFVVRRHLFEGRDEIREVYYPFKMGPSILRNLPKATQSTQTPKLRCIIPYE